MISKESAKEFAIATAKGVISTMPAGGLVAEYIGLAKDRAASKIMQDWIALVDVRLAKIESDLETLADDEFFYSFLHTATLGAMKALQKEKREMYANALVNVATLNTITDEKKAVFIWQLDKYSLVSIKVLHLLSQDNTATKVFNQNMNVQNHVYARMRNFDDDFITYVTDNIPELKNEKSFLYLILQTLFIDGLIEKVDSQHMEQGAACAKKRTTLLGDEFVSFIKLQD